VAISLAMVDVGLDDPPVRRRNRSIRLLHEAQVIPTTGKATSAGSTAGGAATGTGAIGVILPRSIHEAA